MMGGLTLRYFPPTTPLPWDLASDRRGDEVGPKHQTAFPQLLTQTPPTNTPLSQSVPPLLHVYSSKASQAEKVLLLKNKERLI